MPHRKRLVNGQSTERGKNELTQYAIST